MSGDQFPPDCPVTPLGTAIGDDGGYLCVYRDTHGRKVGIADWRHGQIALIALFGGQTAWLEQHYPRWSKPVREYNKAEKRWGTVKEAAIVSFDQPTASRALVRECSRLGPVDMAPEPKP